MNSIERFEAKYVVNDETGCWEWTAFRNWDGYGTFWDEGRMFMAHRWSYGRFVGPIPEGLTLDHLCRVRHCVNPVHLEPVTQHENLLRGNTPAAVNARKTHCIHGHEFTPENTALTVDGRRECRECRRAIYWRKKAA